MPEALDDYLGIVEVSQRLGIHPGTVARLIRAGEIPATKWHNRWLVRRDQLEMFASRYDPRPGRKRKLL